MNRFFLAYSFTFFAFLYSYAQSAPWPSPGMQYGLIYVCNPFDCPDYQNYSFTFEDPIPDSCGHKWYYVTSNLTREVNGQYFVKGTSCGNDLLVYDFNLVTDDTLRNKLTGKDYLIYDHGVLPMLNGTTRRYQIVRLLQSPTSQPFRFIEGIGDAYSGFFPWRDFEGGHSRFICLKDSTGIIYEEGAPWGLDCDSLTCRVYNPKFDFKCQNDTLFFTESTTAASAYYWDFGDGETSTNRSPSHVYAEPGCYYVSLKTEADCIPGYWTEVVKVVNYEAGAWWKKSSTMEQRLIYDWQFLDEQHGWAYDSVHLYKTTNGGANWVEVPYPGPLRRILHMDFRDFTHGVVTISDGSWLYSDLLWTDNGSDFKVIDRGNFYHPTDVTRIDDTTMIEFKQYQDMALTRDGGMTWDTIKDSAPITFVNDVKHFAGGPTYYLGFSQFGNFENWFCRSNDLENWDCNQIGAGLYYGPFSFIDTLNGWVTFNHDIYRTYDAGRNWTLIADRSIWYGGIHDFFMLDSLHGWTTGQRNGIWSTSDGGYTWQQEACDMIGQSTKSPVAFSPTKAFAFVDTEVFERAQTPFQTDSCPSAITLTTEIDQSFLQLHVYPNPATDVVYYRIETEGIVATNQPMLLDLIDAFGKRVRTISVLSESGSIDVRLLPSGVYFLRSQSIGLTEQKRLIVKVVVVHGD
jgi:PKD domain/Secretion system C-terminal sorting domain